MQMIRRLHFLMITGIWCIPVSFTFSCTFADNVVFNYQLL